MFWLLVRYYRLQKNKFFFSVDKEILVVLEVV